MGQAVVGHQGGDVRQLGLLRAQEFLARRHVVEQVAHRNRGAAAQRRFLTAQHLAAGDFDRRTGGFFFRAGFEQQARNRRDGRQRLAAKTQGRDRQQILDVAQLAGGVAFKRQQGIVPQHAATVVHDADESPPARLHFDAQVGRARVERVFEQFLDHRSRPLHHLAGGDFVGDLIRQNANAAHSSKYGSPERRRGQTGERPFVFPIGPALSG